MRISAIDIGTNTLLLLVADVDENGTITPVAYEQRIPRLGKDVDAQKRIGRPAFVRVVDVLRDYQELSKQLKAERLVAVGTSAARDAANRREFLEFIRGQTGISIEVLSGEEEARLTYIGAVSGILQQHQNIGVIDIGGGSTEFTFGTRDRIQGQLSLNIGSVRITERFLHHNPPHPPELASASDFIQDALKQLDGIQLEGTTIVGVAGTATTLATLDQGLAEFDRTKITGYKLTRQAVERLYHRLRTMKVEQIRSLSNTTEGRADILTAGTLILYELMSKMHTTEIIVSERGVRYGVLLREWKKQKPIPKL